MKRYHQELERTKRVHRLHLRWVHNWPMRAVICVCELQAGRFRKRKALGCGSPRCFLCHYEKLLDISSIKDRLRENHYADSLKDYLDATDEG